MKPSYDVIIIGGGLAGLAGAYQLARRQASVLLLEANELGSGTSGASAGRAQIAESHRGRHLQLVRAGLARLEKLETELEVDFEWRRLGNLMLIEQEKHWGWWTEQVNHLTGQGFSAEMLDLPALQTAEPLLQVERFLGAAWCLEGHLNPLKLCQAYARAACRHGARLEPRTPVIGFERQGERLTCVCTPSQRYAAETVVVTAGAWSGELLAEAGVCLPVQFTHAEALITEPLRPLLNNHIGLADFYETIHNQAQAISVGLAQQKSGTLLVTEAVHRTEMIHRRNSAWGLPGIARDLLQLLPGLSGVRVVRSWAAPSPFLPDEQPAIGWLPVPRNLFVATCFHLTITTIPVLSEMMAGMILGEPAAALEEYSPTRFHEWAS